MSFGGAELLIGAGYMEYVTFANQKRTWRLYRGTGRDGEVLAERSDSLSLLDLSAAQQPVLWVCSQPVDNQRSIVQRLILPELRIEPIAWDGGRIGALASAPNGEQALALELPNQPNEQPGLWLWSGHSWTSVDSQVIPDISSKLAWLDAARIAYESNSRQVTVLHLDTRGVEVGPPGCCPAAAGEIGEWYAINQGKVLRFPFEEPFRHAPATLDSFKFGHVLTLRVTHDGQVCTWTEPRFLYQSKGYLQARGRSRQRFREIDDGIGAVLGPYPLA